ncbi:MAG: hypothetical protein ACR2OW_17760 [Methyloligellaceae bacterium]
MTPAVSAIFNPGRNAELEPMTPDKRMTGTMGALFDRRKGQKFTFLYAPVSTYMVETILQVLRLLESSDNMQHRLKL